ncbi:MAG: hypothetical protein JWO11_3494 [Nocardioides sp.]|nr:hypothetical protein [Nocardioides sp.]
MPRVRMKDSIANRNYSFYRGELVDVSPEEAQVWIAADMAELVTEERILTPERDQRSEVRRGPGRPRKHPR